MGLILAAITPVLVFLYLIYRKDVNKEPAKLLAKCFFGGFISIALTLAIVALIEDFGAHLSHPFAKSFFDAFFLAAIPEEISKWLILYWIVWKSNEFDEHYDGIIYAVFVSLGFALVENIMYVVNGGMGVALMRAVLSVPGHGFFGVLMGYYFSLAKFGPVIRRQPLIVMSLAIPILFHGLYNFALMYMSADSSNPWLVLLLLVLFIYVVVMLWKLGIRKIKKHVAFDREEEAKFDITSDAEND
jgi:RsiW-degrading membrane proteinase PrsW (M82 family)